VSERVSPDHGPCMCPFKQVCPLGGLSSRSARQGDDTGERTSVGGDQ
jgi:hypothetical protein